MLTLQETRSTHYSMNRPGIEFITYIYNFIVSRVSTFKFSPYFGDFLDILYEIRHNGGFGIANTPSFYA